MELKEIDSLIKLVERGEIELPKNHKIVKAMQRYFKDLYGEDHSMSLVHKVVKVSMKQYGINYSITILDALEHYEKEGLNG